MFENERIFLQKITISNFTNIPKEKGEDEEREKNEPGDDASSRISALQVKMNTTTTDKNGMDEEKIVMRFSFIKLLESSQLVLNV